MNKLKKVKTQLILAVIYLFSLLPVAVNAATIQVLANESQKELTLIETIDGKLMHNNSETKPNKVVTAVLTAYSSTPDQTDDDPFIAASGKRVYDGMVAANWLPFGTKIKIPSLFGEKVFTVDDRMNSRYGYGRMDIWMNGTRQEVRSFGVKKVDIEVYFVEKAPAKTRIASDNTNS